MLGVMSRVLRFLCPGVLACATVLACQAQAHDTRTKHDEKTIVRPVPDVHGRARDYFTNLPVITQYGERLRFYDDVLKDKTVLVSLFYSECPDACPLTTVNMAAVQDLLGEEMGRSVHFVSVTVDPETDTPEVIRRYAEHFQAGDGWLFLTGSKEELSTIAHRLGQADGNPAAHPPFLLAGDTRRGYWKKFLPDTPADKLAAFLHDLAHRP